MIGPWDEQTIVEVQPTWVDVRGVLTADWNDPVRINHEGFEVRPGSSSGSANGASRDFELGTGVSRVRKLYGPPDTVIDPRSRIELPGEDGQFTILDGPNTFTSTEQMLGSGVGPGNTALIVGIKEG